MKLYLASQSPRRKQLLADLGVEFEVLPIEVDESTTALESAEEYVARLGEAKARAGLDVLAGRGESQVLTLGSDTTVVADQDILGKPRDYDDFADMMERLSGRSHRVFTSVAVASHDSVDLKVVESRVVFAELEPQAIRAYWDSGEPQDKAGGYSVQGLGAVFIKRIEGSYSAIVGLPLRETAQLLTKRGLQVWSGALERV
ncbi:septum formation protein Maf [Saccharospirillum sp. MSK14-1]|uniref:Maf family protein n=1 Tax=Saccharospirillum sp. MSK14-1 TaxID=1897632 RepID=UPI000D35D632|nr:Maf family protein [Saccharospirillum sp. MSK14-1]PTY37047.1 septum formation protein Maf [Saccharospirillum sp. MSK14-1]